MAAGQGAGVARQACATGISCSVPTRREWRDTSPAGGEKQQWWWCGGEGGGTSVGPGVVRATPQRLLPSLLGPERLGWHATLCKWLRMLSSVRHAAERGWAGGVKCGSWQRAAGWQPAAARRPASDWRLTAGRQPVASRWQGRRLTCTQTMSNKLGGIVPGLIRPGKVFS